MTASSTVFVIMAMCLLLTAVASAEYLAPFDALLQGRWLVRRHLSGGSASAIRAPYTHQLTLVKSSKFDGEVFGELTPYEGSGDLANSFLSWWSSRGRPTVVESTETPIAVWNRTYHVQCSFEGNAEGLLTVSESGAAEAAQEQSSFTYPILSHVGLTDQHRHRSLSVTSPDATKGLIVSALSDGADAAANAVRFYSMSLHFLDESHAIATLLFASNGIVSAHQPLVVVLKRFSTEEEGQSWKSLVGTIGLLVIVAAVKFGPRQYMRWKGMSPNDVFRKRGLTVNKKGVAAPGLKQASEILQSMKK
jgi:hypothetical protein